MSAAKIYSQSSDPRHAYAQRRFMARQQLKTMKGIELQKTIESLSVELEWLKTEISECEEAIHVLKQDGDPKDVRCKFHINYSLNARTKDVVEIFKEEIRQRKDVARWLRRERAIFLWEKRRRQIAAIKNPLVKLKAKRANDEAHRLLCEMKNLMDRLNKLAGEYLKTSTEHYELSCEIERLNFSSEKASADPIWTDKQMPRQIQEAALFFRALELGGEGEKNL